MAGERLEEGIPLLQEAIFLRADLERQIQRWASLALCAGLIETEREYIDPLLEIITRKRGEFLSQLEAYQNRFDVPLVVEPRIRLDQLFKLTGIASLADLTMVKVWGKAGSKTPQVPYFTWAQDGRKNLNISVATVRANMTSDEWAGDFDGIAIYLRFPGVLEDHSLALPGFEIGLAGSLDLEIWNEKPVFGPRSIESALPRYGAVTCGRKIPLVI